MGILYHGSVIANIHTIKAESTLHGTDNTKVVYLTDNLPYSLFYIWDSNHNIKSSKHVTAWIKNGIVYYEEQFEGQLEAFYKGVSGYLYCVESNQNFKRVENRESMWFSEINSAVFETICVSDVYTEIMKYVKVGKVKIINFADVPKERITELYNIITQRIIKSDLLKNTDSADAKFYQTFFRKAWDDAVKKPTI
ncbi:MAG: hypothetical protein IJC50_03290 [Clostridia bacterium]|nr:hypothetical protein [Clostridia bacterium]